MTVVVRAVVEKHYDFPDDDMTDMHEAICAAKSDFAVPDGAVVVEESWSVSL